MPTYEFRCPNGHTFDQLHKISDAPQVATCSTCGAEAARVISGGAGLVFKGSGFYLTDYGKNAHRTSGPAAAGGEGKGEAKTDGASGGSKESGASGGASGGGAAAPASGATSSGGSAAGGSTSGGSSSSGSAASGGSSSPGGAA
jgi:putative FmdB family regulatory protein